MPSTYYIRYPGDPALDGVEDDSIVAFHDLEPQAPIHVLIIPRRHPSTLLEASPDDAKLLGALQFRAIEIARALMGRTFGYEAAPGTIRGDFGASKSYNLVHGSDGVESAATEISLYFREDELLEYSPAGSEWVFQPGEK